MASLLFRLRAGLGLHVFFIVTVAGLAALALAVALAQPGADVPHSTPELATQLGPSLGRDDEAETDTDQHAHAEQAEGWQQVVDRGASWLETHGVER